MVNDIPYGPSPDNLYVCPSDAMGRTNGVIMIQNTASKLGTINLMMKHLKGRADAIKELRQRALEADVEKFKRQIKKEGRIKATVKPTIGDIVLVKDDDKFGYSKFGIITGIPTPQTLEIRVRNGDKMVNIERPQSITVPIVAQCLYQ